MEYENIPLRLYLNLFETKTYKDLVIEGQATAEQCAQAWEKIVTKNSEAVGNLSMSAHLDNYRTFVQFMADYNFIKATLMLLLLRVDDKDISMLETKGYKIITDKGQRKYEESIEAALRRSDNLVTRIRMKHNELMVSGGDNKKVSFEELIANLNLILGFEVNDNITLARFNEYNKLLSKRKK